MFNDYFKKFDVNYFIIYLLVKQYQKIIIDETNVK